VALANDGAPAPEPDEDERFRTRNKSPRSAEVRGFTLHADITVRAAVCAHASNAPHTEHSVATV
jgi:hypothetical protein